MTGKRSQLWMRLAPIGEIADPELPDGYWLRTFKAGDEANWIALLRGGEFNGWDGERLQRMLTRDEPRLPLDGIFFITHGDLLAGSACMFLQASDGGTVGELGWVVVDPTEQGHGLGLQVCRAALGYARRCEVGSVYLRTEESRLAAIRTYLQLGFRPEMKDETHPKRWAALLPRLQS